MLKVYITFYKIYVPFADVVICHCGSGGGCYWTWHFSLFKREGKGGNEHLYARAFSRVMSLEWIPRNGILSAKNMDFVWLLAYPGGQYNAFVSYIIVCSGKALYVSFIKQKKKCLIHIVGQALDLRATR